MMTFLYFVAGFLLLFSALLAWMVKTGPVGVKLFGFVFLVCIAAAAYMVLIVCNLSNWAVATAILGAVALGWFFEGILGKASIN